jgi:uncharacterized protein YbjQ (UPF0145 family)
MEDFLVLFQLGLPLALVTLGWFAGATTERRHYLDIKAREQKFLNQPALSSKQYDPELRVREAEMACGSVVVSIDHFKRFMSALRMLFGGEIQSYASLIDRARREAILRMKESAPDADAYLNMRLQTSSISSSTGREAIGTVEVLAYATAVKFAPVGQAEAESTTHEI